MDIESTTNVKSDREKCKTLAEVSNVERQLWTSVQTKGLLSADVRHIYHKACGLYEKIFLGNKEVEELQETEYSLWKLHYKQIDEFRKKASHNPQIEAGPSRNPESIQEGFKLFVEESFRFYKDLISKFKRHYGFQDSILLYNNHPATLSGSADHPKLHKCRLLCHRLLVRLGDLARYLEANQDRGIRKRNWSSVVHCYFEAAKMYPDGGNPQNQLALLATPPYIGDEFLALYHCVRSIAVKEPFPDASDNLHFIFERNMSAHIQSLSFGSHFNFLKPSERVLTSVQAQASNGASHLTPSGGTCYTNDDFWPLFVRLISFFFLESSMEGFSCSFASTIRDLEALLALDDAKLSRALESYQNVNILRPGPYRLLQVVSVLIFTVNNLNSNPEKDLKKLQMALIATFICIGRVVERCLIRISTDDFPLLPTVMVFSEWLVEVLQRVDKCKNDENLTSAMIYFFSSYVELLNQLLKERNYAKSPNLVALWEDYELRGFVPVTQSHSSLDFSTHWKNEANFRAKNDCRIHRIIHAAIKIAKKSADSTKSWILYDKGGNFSSPRVAKTRESNEAEDDEDIVFKPINRHNSAQESEDGLKQLVNGRQSLRQASLLLIAQNRALISSLTHPEPSIPETRLAPPSLSAWVLNETETDNLSNLRLGSTSAQCSPPTLSAPLLPEGAAWSKPLCYMDNLVWNQPVPPPPPPPWPRLLSRGEAMGQVSAVYTESAVSMHPFANGLYDHRRDVGVDQQQQLLQYLKEKQWRIQQEAQTNHYTNSRR